MDANWQEVLDKNRFVYLYDLYGNLLTEKSAATLSLYLNEDLSVSEIAQELTISRQAVHDSLQKSLQHLEQYEGKLGLYGSQLNLKKELNKVSNLLDEQKMTEAKLLLREISNRI